jgi:DHA1 family multidrug resistance protein-like MFS transporter
MPVYSFTIILATLFEIGCALSPSLPALIILRLFAGFFSAAPLSNAGGSLNDIGNPVFRTLGLPLFTTTGFVGPILGPIIGSYIAQSGLGWRWCYWITAIWNGASFVLVMLFMPETLGPALLKYKAIAWRKAASESDSAGRTSANDSEGSTRGLESGEKKLETGRIRWRAEIEDESLGIALQRNLKRPFIMLVKEPILIFFSIYLTGMSRFLSPRVYAGKELELTISGLYMPIRTIQFLSYRIHPKRPLTNRNRSDIYTRHGWLFSVVWIDDMAFRKV